MTGLARPVVDVMSVMGLKEMECDAGARQNVQKVMLHLSKS